MKIIKYIKNNTILLLLLANFLLSKDFGVQHNLDEVSKIIYEPKVINDYIKYPDLAKNFSISGTSTALFIVNKEGKIKNIKIEKIIWYYV